MQSCLKYRQKIREHYRKVVNILQSSRKNQGADIIGFKPNRMLIKIKDKKGGGKHFGEQSCD